MRPGPDPNPPNMDLLKFLMRFNERHGRPPSLREIGDTFDLCLRGASLWLDRLQEFGYIERNRRTITVLMDARQNLVKLQFVGVAD